MDALRHIVRALRLTAAHAERAAGISAAQAFALKSLDEVKAASLGELAARTLTDASSVSVVVRRLHDAGLVRRSRDPNDARRAVIALTPRGRAVTKRLPEATQSALIASFEALPRATRDAVARGLTAWVGVLGARGAPSLFFEERASDGRRRAPAKLDAPAQPETASKPGAPPAQPETASKPGALPAKRDAVAKQGAPPAKPGAVAKQGAPPAKPGAAAKPEATSRTSAPAKRAAHAPA